MSSYRASKRLVRPPYHHGDLRRALVDAALALLAETQRWDFSLREVARRAGVSHNAPYSHFADKRDLLAAVATAGFETLRATMLAASADTASSSEALEAIGFAYLNFGYQNPAHYRLMFGRTPLTANDGPPADVAAAADAAQAVLHTVIRLGAEDGTFKVAQNNSVALAAAALAAWSLVHGLTMLVIDGLTKVETSPDLQQLAQRVSSTFLNGLAR